MVSAARKIDQITIIGRAIRPESGDWPPEIAQGILNITLAEEDRDRMNVLAAHARAGNLPEEERVEVEAYMQATSLIELLQAKARASVAIKPAIEKTPGTRKGRQVRKSFTRAAIRAGIGR